MSKIGWLDLTVQDASTLCDFYSQVAGYDKMGISMGDYEDYCLTAEDGAVAGVCHARGGNADLPPMWIPYFLVDKLEERLETLKAKGGTPIGGIRGGHGADKFVVFKDPAGAVAALYQKG